MTPEQQIIVACWEKHEHLERDLSSRRLVDLVSEETGADVDTIVGALMVGLKVERTMIDVVYQIFFGDDPWYEITKGKEEFLAPTWVHSECDAEEAARAVCETHFDTEDWQEEFGESDDAVVLLQVHRPEYLRGFYLMTMERTIRATAAIVEDPRPEWAIKNSAGSAQ